MFEKIKAQVRHMKARIAARREKNPVGPVVGGMTSRRSLNEDDDMNAMSSASPAESGAMTATTASVEPGIVDAQIRIIEPDPVVPLTLEGNPKWCELLNDVYRAALAHDRGRLRLVLKGLDTVFLVTNHAAEMVGTSEFCQPLNDPSWETIDGMLRDPAGIRLFASGRLKDWGGVLHHSIISRDQGNFDRALMAGADVNTGDYLGRTPLHIAVEYGQRDFAKTLIAAGASMVWKNCLRRNVCEEVLWYLEFKRDDRLQDTRNLILRDILASSAMRGDPMIMHYACRYGLKDLVFSLVRDDSLRNRLINCQDSEGRTPIFEATAAGNAAIIKILEVNGAVMDQKDNHGYLPGVPVDPRVLLKPLDPYKEM